MDTFVAAHLVGPEGLAVGFDLTPEMIARARSAASQTGGANTRFEQGSVEALPFADAAFDFVISNGVLNLVPDKDAAFREIARVLRPGGTLVAADIVVMATVPPEVLEDKAAWST
jgi:ubiquinone/menaquinone biosynthesis C-methylase UbiE